MTIWLITYRHRYWTYLYYFWHRAKWSAVQCRAAAVARKSVGASVSPHPPQPLSRFGPVERERERERERGKERQSSKQEKEREKERERQLLRHFRRVRAQGLTHVFLHVHLRYLPPPSPPLLIRAACVQGRRSPSFLSRPLWPGRKCQ